MWSISHDQTANSDGLSQYYHLLDRSDRVTVHFVRMIYEKCLFVALQAERCENINNEAERRETRSCSSCSLSVLFGDPHVSAGPNRISLLTLAERRKITRTPPCVRQHCRKGFFCVCFFVFCLEI